MFSLEKTRPWEDLTAASQHLNGAYKKDGGRLFTRAGSDRTRVKIFKLMEGRYRLDIRNKFLKGGEAQVAVEAPSIEHSRPSWMGP